jgi:hypothetical protein
MKRFLLSVLVTIGSLSISNAQTSSDSTQYNYGAIGVQQVAPESSIAIQGIITLTDGLGRTVLEQKGNGSNVQQIDVNELPAGSYVLRVIGDDGFNQQRIQNVK